MNLKVALLCFAPVLVALPGCLLEGFEPPASYVEPPPPPPPPPPLTEWAPAMRIVPDAPREFATPPPRAAAILATTTSSSFDGWPASNATDGDPNTSWYSANGDSAALGRSPYFEVALAGPARVHRVTILGQRDPAYPKGYTIHVGRLELLDAAGHVLFEDERAGRGPRRDFEYRFRGGIDGVASVRFTSLEDDGDKNPYGDVAIAEFRVD